MGGKEQNSPIYISRIIPGGVAHRQGRLKRGDQLLSVNGVSVENEHHEKAVELLKSAQGNVCVWKCSFVYFIRSNKWHKLSNLHDLDRLIIHQTNFDSVSFISQELDLATAGHLALT